MNDRIGAARYVTKTNTTAPDTFQSEEMGFLGNIADDIYFHNEVTKKHTIETDFDISKIDKLPQVDIIYGYQSDGRYLFDAAVKAGAKGIIYAGSGNGSISNEAKKGAAVIRSSRTGSGIVTPNPELEKKHLSASNSLNPPKSRILLMLALTKTDDPEKIQKYFNEY